MGGTSWAEVICAPLYELLWGVLSMCVRMYDLNALSCIFFHRAFLLGAGIVCLLRQVNELPTNGN